MASKNSTKTQTPPVRAVAADAHWQAKLAKLRDRRRPEQKLVFCDDEQVKSRLMWAETALATARARAGDAYVEAGPVTGRDRDSYIAAHVQAEQEAVDQARADVDAASVTLHFRALRNKDFETLVGEHPPSEKDAENGAQFDISTFPGALIAACHVEYDEDGAEVPGMSAQDAEVLVQEWPTAESNALFSVVWALNQTLRADLGKG